MIVGLLQIARRAWLARGPDAELTSVSSLRRRRAHNLNYKAGLAITAALGICKPAHKHTSLGPRRTRSARAASPPGHLAPHPAARPPPWPRRAWASRWRTGTVPISGNWPSAPTE